MDNLKLISEKVNTDIDPNGAPESILAQNHNDILQAFLQSSGKYMGLPYLIKTNYQGVVGAGEFIINSGSFNSTIDVFVSKKTSDATDLEPILKLYGKGDILHFKDFKGKSVYFYINEKLDTIDNNQTPIFYLTLDPFPANINYTYQANEQNIGVIELIKATAMKDIFQGVEVNLFWNGRGFNDNQEVTEFSKFIERKKFVGQHTDGLIKFRTLTAQVYFLGVEIKNYNAIKDFNPKIMIERYRRPQQNVTNHIYHRSHGGYKYTNFFRDTILASTPSEIPGNANLAQLTRPVLFPITGEKGYYDLFSENYFSQKDFPKALGNQHFVTKHISMVNIQDDDAVVLREIPTSQKGFAHCRMRIRLEISEGVFVISEPLAYFKIIDCLMFSLFGDPISKIKFSYE